MSLRVVATPSEAARLNLPAASYGWHRCEVAAKTKSAAAHVSPVGICAPQFGGGSGELLAHFAGAVVRLVGVRYAYNSRRELGAAVGK